MNHTASGIIKVLCCFCIMFFAVSCSAEDLYVSVNGCDANPGTKERPFASLEAARDAIRNFKKDGTFSSDKVTVWIGEGIYILNSTFELNESDSGLKEAPVVYRAVEGHQVRVIGGRIIEPSSIEPVTDKTVLQRIIEKDARDKIRQIDLKKLGVTEFGSLKARGFRRPYVNPGPEIFIDDYNMRLARWPNEGMVKLGQVIDRGSLPFAEVGLPEDFDYDYSDRGATFTFDYNRPQLWTQADDIWLSGFFKYGFADDTIKVKSIDLKTKTITMDQTHMYGTYSGEDYRAYFALNLLEEIDQPGEYYMDRDSGILYFYPPYDLKDAAVSVSILGEPMVAMEGASYVTFEDITFECTRGIGIYMERGKGSRIRNCTLRNMGVVAVCIGKGIEPTDKYRHPNYKKGYYQHLDPVSRQLGNWHEYIYENTVFDRRAGTDHGVVGCRIYNIGAGGIHMGGGNRLTLEPGNNFVRNCEIYNCNRLDRSYKAGVNIEGVGNIIEHCEIHDAPSAAIYLHGNDHLIQYNRIHNCCQESDDMGAFYMGRDPSEYGNVIRYNLWYNIGRGLDTHRTTTVYFDDGACGSTVLGNVFYKAGNRVIQIGGGSDNRIINNVFIHTDLAIRRDNRLNGWAARFIEKDGLFERRLNAVNYDKPPYSERYPHLADYWNETDHPRRNVIKRNVFVNVEQTHQGGDEWGKFENNFVTDIDPGFADLQNLNFSLSEDSPVFEKIEGFEPIPLDKIGLRK